MHRFIDTFYIVNVLVLLTYIPVRYYMLEDKNLVREEEWFGATRVSQNSVPRQSDFSHVRRHESGL